MIKFSNLLYNNIVNSYKKNDNNYIKLYKMFQEFDICLIKNCVNKDCTYLNGKNCVFLRKEGTTYIVIVSNETNMRSLQIKNNHLELDKDKNIECVFEKNKIINTKERIENCKKNFTLNIDVMLIYDNESKLQLVRRTGAFANIVMDYWNNQNKVFSIPSFKLTTKTILLDLLKDIKESVKK